MLLELICTFPVTTCECERCVSSLGRIKTALRATMCEPRLNGLAMLHVQYTRLLDVDMVARLFMRRNPRRIVMPQPFLNSDSESDGGKESEVSSSEGDGS